MRRVALAPALALLVVAACAHRPGGPAAPLSEASKRMAAEAAGVQAVAYEEDFVDARLVFKSLPVGAPGRAALRAKMFDYLLGPLGTLNPARIRKDAIELNTNDDYDRILESFKDAVELVDPAELWDPRGVQAALGERERAQLAIAARLVRAVFAPRGNETAVAMSLVVLATLEPKEPAWPAHLAQLLPWIENGAQLAFAGAGPRQSTTVADALESVSASWPAPMLVQRLADLYVGRQERLATALRRPLGTGAPRTSQLGEILAEGESIQQTALNLASLYLRCGQIGRASAALSRVEGKPGDDPDLRQLVAAAAKDGASEGAYLALARRFLPRLEPLAGTSTDRIDTGVALAVLRESLERHPTHAETLVLASTLARLVPAPFLALRYMEEAGAVLEKSKASSEELAAVSSALLELRFLKLRARMDPEHPEPAAREAAAVRTLSADVRQRFGPKQARPTEAEIDFQLARGFLEAGLPDRAQPLLEQVKGQPDTDAEAAMLLAELASKRGEPARAATILRAALDRHGSAEPAQETIAYVTMQSKLAGQLGYAYEAAGNGADAVR